MKATTLPAAAAKVADSNYEVVRNGAIKAASWLGRQVQFIGGTVKDVVLRIVSWAQPFFTCIKKFFLETFDKSKEFFIANKEFTVPAAVLIGGAAFIALVFDRLCDSKPTPGNA